MKTILIIEDNINIRENTCEILEMEGYKVFLAINGRSGIASAKENKPNLILCDVQMPNGDGYEVLNALKNDPKTSSILFVFLTSSAERKGVEITQGKIADGFIRKPFNAKSLLDTIVGLLGSEQSQ